MFKMICAILIAYAIGNISPSIMLGKARGIDIKKEGSGNAGTTNALRVMGAKAGVITLVVDILKGIIAVLLGHLIAGPFAAMCCAVAVFCGHVWPVLYGFKGGKGVATAFGALLGINPLLGVAALAVVAVGVFASKRMSVGSLLGALSFPILALLVERDFLVLGCIMALIIIIKHRGNIVRLIRKEEPIMSIFNKKDKNEEAAEEN